MKLSPRTTISFCISKWIYIMRMLMIITAIFLKVMKIYNVSLFTLFCWRKSCAAFNTMYQISLLFRYKYREPLLHKAILFLLFSHSSFKDIYILIFFFLTCWHKNNTVTTAPLPTATNFFSRPWEWVNVSTFACCLASNNFCYAYIICS